MKAITDHVFAFKIAAQQLAKGKFWLYLIPSLLIFAAYYGISSSLAVENEESWFAGVPIIGKYLNQGAVAVVSFGSYLFFMFYKFFILTVLSPVNCLLSEKVDNELTGAKFSGGLTRIIEDLVRAVFIVIIALFLNLVFMGVWWLVSWLFGLDQLDSIVYWLISSYFIGFAFYDFSLERYGVTTFGSWSFGFSHFWYMLLTGALFNLIYMIPHAGILLAPFLVTIISTIAYLNNKKMISNTKEITHE